jgi:uncharacterized protein YegL
MVAAKVRLTVLGFSDDVCVRLALADVRETPQLPQVQIRQSTSYQAAFGDLLVRIPQDVRTLKGQGYEVFRPAVFFLTDGQPNPRQDWNTAHGRLIDRSATHGSPNIIACGVGGHVDAQAIVAVATAPAFAFVTQRGAGIGEAITAFFTNLTTSVIHTGGSLDSDHPTMAFERPDQFVLAMDIM